MKATVQEYIRPIRDISYFQIERLEVGKTSAHHYGNEIELKCHNFGLAIDLDLLYHEERLTLRAYQIVCACESYSSVDCSVGCRFHFLLCIFNLHQNF